MKEIRYQRPTLRRGDLPTVSRDKHKILNAIRNSSFRRTPVDRLELMLGLMGRYATIYCLTFRPESLPSSFSGVRKTWRKFLRAARHWRENNFDYIYCIEGKHGDHRYHIHLVLRNEDFSPAEVRFLWGGGEVDDEPLLLSASDSFRRTARYLTKERTDGVVIPISARTWVASRSLYSQLPPPTKTTSASGRIPIPPGALWQDTAAARNPFGAYRYAAYITGDRRSHDKK